MVKTIIRREFIDNIQSFKFMACVLVALVLTLISTLVLTRDYQDRLEDYNKGLAVAQEKLGKIYVYSQLEVGIFKKPSPLSILVSGRESRTGNYVYLTHREIPTSLKGGFIKNEFSRAFSFFDLASVVVIVFSILVVLLSYHSVSGEKEDGALSLVLSNSVARYKFLLGKYIGGLISIVVPLTICFIVGIMVVLFSRGVETGSDFFIPTILLYFFSILYLSSILLTGILVSSRTKTSFHSLIFLLAFYLIAVFLLPLAVRNYSERMAIKKAKNYENNVNEFVRERNRKIAEAWNQVPVKRSWATMSGDFFRRINPRETVEFYKGYYPLREKIREEDALKIYDLKRKDFQVKEKIRRFRGIFLAFIPPSSFEETSELIAGTGQNCFNLFFQQLTVYWNQYVRYLHEKDAFSLKYFFPGPEELTLEEKEIISGVNEAMDAWKKEGQVFWTRSEAYKRAMNYNPQLSYLNLGDLPVFQFRKPGFLERIKTISFNALILIFYNLLALILAHFSFSRYDPRLNV
jgi:ABC-type transport system involved in multi-copper enzyme maturation permease subunit